MRPTWPTVDKTDDGAEQAAESRERDAVLSVRRRSYPRPRDDDGDGPYKTA